MIAPMTKYSLLVYHREYEDFLEKLRELGVVHILEKETGITDEIRDQYQYIDRVDKAVRFLKKREAEPEVSEDKHNGSEVFEEITSLQHQVDQNHNQMNSLRKEIKELQPWGNFSIERIKKLREHGIAIRFFATQTRKFDQQWKEEYTIEEIGTHGGLVYFIVILYGEQEVNIQAEELSVPTRSLNSLREATVKLQKEMEAIESRLKEWIKIDSVFLETHKELMEEGVTGNYSKAIAYCSALITRAFELMEPVIPGLEDEYPPSCTLIGHVYLLHAERVLFSFAVKGNKRAMKRLIYLYFQGFELPYKEKGEFWLEMYKSAGGKKYHKLTCIDSSYIKMLDEWINR